MDALRALPADARNGRRLAIISDLLAAHRLIDARASGALRELKRALGPVPRLARGGSAAAAPEVSSPQGLPSPRPSLASGRGR